MWDEKRETKGVVGVVTMQVWSCYRSHYREEEYGHSWEENLKK